MFPLRSRRLGVAITIKEMLAWVYFVQNFANCSLFTILSFGEGEEEILKRDFTIILEVTNLYFISTIYIDFSCIYTPKTWNVKVKFGVFIYNLRKYILRFRKLIWTRIYNLITYLNS